MIKIVLLIRSLETGGAERQLVALAKGLHSRGVGVRVLTFYPGGALRHELELAGVPVEDLGKRARWDVLPFLIRLYHRLSTIKPQVIYSWLPTANTLAAMIGRLAGVPRIVWGVRASNIEFGRYDWLQRVDFFLSRLTSRLADGIICNSEAGLRFHAAYGYPAERMVVIENGIDTERFRFDPDARTRLRSEWKIGDREIVIGLVARLDPMKDHETFLRAAALLVRKHENVRFVCVGDGPAAYRIRLQDLAAELGVSRQVLWAGLRHDLPAVYSAFDIASSSSSFGEGFSNAIAEAMSCERPCVATDVGDSARIVGDAGWIVRPRDPEALAAGWNALIAMPAESRSMLGVWERERIIAEFSVTAMVERTIDALLRSRCNTNN